jgi:hypothetical protein
MLAQIRLGKIEFYPGYFQHPDEELTDAYQEIYERLEGRHVRCVECVAAAQVCQARKEGRPDPFPVYERTLTYNHREVLGQLEGYLVRNFKFQRSTIGPDKRKPAVFVQAGDYRQPMTVKAYYVTKAQDQDRIASLVTNFLRGVELNQCKMLFLEAEVWHTWSNPEKGVSGGYRGEEKPLREIYVNC